MTGSAKNKKKKSFWPYYVVVGICVAICIGLLTGLTHAIYFFSQAQKTNEAKTFMIPVESYAQSQGWKSVQVINNPAIIDNSVPTYREVFLTDQTPYEVASNMLTLIRKEGFLNGSGISSEMIQTAIKNHYDVDLGGLDVKGNKMLVTITTKEYANEDDSITRVRRGKTAVIVYTEYNGYLK